MNDIETVNEILKTADALVGFKQVNKAIAERAVDKVVLAADTDEHIAKKIKSACLEYKTEIIPYSNKAELGRIMGIQVPCAVVGIKKLIKN